MNWSRPLSLGFYLLATSLIWAARGATLAFVFALSQAVVVSMIWCADFFADWLGPPPIPGGLGVKIVDEASPAWLVTGFGWLILIGVFVVAYAYA